MYSPWEDPIPDVSVAKVRAFVKDMAYGALYGGWSAELVIGDATHGKNLTPLNIKNRVIFNALVTKWQKEAPDVSLLIAFEYLDFVEREGAIVRYRLTSKAFLLLEQPSPASIFISYRRSESSAFALLLLARFKTLGLEPFLDMSIEAGDDWRERLEGEVTSREYFIVLIAPTTLESPYVRQEIGWALAAGAQAIPVWHNGFSDELVSQFQESYRELELFLDKQAIRVDQENALAYEGAIIQLLNRFGFTP
jgi:hypothetical protein